MVRSGVRPKTLDWPERSKFWLFAHGAGLDPETGDTVGKGKWNDLVDKIKEKLEDEINDVDELTQVKGFRCRKQ